MKNLTSVFLFVVMLFLMVNEGNGQTILYNAQALGSIDTVRLANYRILCSSVNGWMLNHLQGFTLNQSDTMYVDSLIQFYKDPVAFILATPSYKIPYDLFKRIDEFSKSTLPNDSSIVKSVERWTSIAQNVATISQAAIINIDSTLKRLHDLDDTLKKVKNLTEYYQQLDATTVPSDISLQNWLQRFARQPLGWVVDSLLNTQSFTAFQGTSPFDSIKVYFGVKTSSKVVSIIAIDGEKNIVCVIDTSVVGLMKMSTLTPTYRDTLKFFMTNSDSITSSELKKRFEGSNINIYQIHYLIDSLQPQSDTFKVVILDSTLIALAGQFRQVAINPLFAVKDLEEVKKHINDSNNSALSKTTLIGELNIDPVRSPMTLFIENRIDSLEIQRQGFQNKLRRYADYYKRDKVFLKTIKTGMNEVQNKAQGVVFAKSRGDTLPSIGEVLPLTQPVALPLGSDMPNLDQTVKVGNPSSGLTESQAIDAIGSFIAEQVEQDIVSSVLAEFEAAANGKKIDYLFPKTTTLLKTLGGGERPITDITNAIRRSMCDDLHTFFDSLASHKCDTTNLFYIDDTLRTELKIAVDFSEKVNAGYNAAQLFDYMYREYFNYGKVTLGGLRKNHRIATITNFLRFVYVAESAFRDTASQQQGVNYWVSPSELQKLDNPKTRNFFTALLYLELCKNDSLFNNGSFTARWKRESFIDSLVAECYETLTQLDKLEKATKRLSSDKSSSVSGLINNYFSAYLDLLDDMSRLYTFVTDEPIDTSLIRDFRYAFYGYKSILAGDYSTLLASATGIATDCLTARVNQLTSRGDDKDSILARSIYLSGAETIKTLNKYLSLFVDLVNARNQEDLKNAIAKTSNSSGGFMAKKAGGFKLSIDAYPGLYAGTEFALSEKASGNFGFSSPIGLDFSFDKHNEGLIFSVLDFGPVVSYRIAQGSTKGFPSNITFAQLISPGLYFKYSPWKFNALTFMVGMQVSPELRSIVDSNVVLGKKTYFRYGFSATYDVPFFYFLDNDEYASDAGFMDRKTSVFHLSMDAYPGIFLGSYRDQAAIDAVNYGLAAPMGVDVSWWKQNVGFFVSLFDFGSAVSWGRHGRFLLADGTYGQIFSPGICFHWSPFCNPFTILVGIEDNTSVTSDKKFVREGLTLAYDIPFFYFVR